MTSNIRFIDYIIVHSFDIVTSVFNCGNTDQIEMISISFSLRVLELVLKNGNNTLFCGNRFIK